MIYVALLRGINVGGNRKVDMKSLKAMFERAGMKTVATYINSGNVIFQHDSVDETQLAQTLEAIIEKDFGFNVKVLLCSLNTMETIIKTLPDSWTNDAVMKCDVMFLWESINREDVTKQLIIKPEFDIVKYVPGALLWKVDHPNVTRSGMMKLVGTDLYKQMTIRNCNTTRKLYGLMKSLEASSAPRA